MNIGNGIAIILLGIAVVMGAVGDMSQNTRMENLENQVQQLQQEKE